MSLPCDIRLYCKWNIMKFLFMCFILRQTMKHIIKTGGRESRNSKFEAMCVVMRESWDQIPALPLQAIRSQGVNTACLCLSFLTCKVEVKTEVAL